MKTFRTIVSLLAVLVILAPAFNQTAAGQDIPSSNDLIIILDASGSMWGQIDGENKIVIARRVLRNLASELDADVEVGLVAYGHRREGDCKDIETVLAMTPLDAEAFSGIVDGLNPKGKTPITASIQHAVNMLDEHDGPATVILVSDGLETCDGDPCAAAREAKESGIELLMHVIGFDLGDADASTLQCAAEATGGRYYDAQNADELASALEEVVEKPVDDTESVITVLATANGELIDVGVRVVDIEKDSVVAFQRTYAHEETNPRHIGVEAGTYDIGIKAIRLSGDPSTGFESVVVPPGDTVFKYVDFSPGTLAVGVTRNKELSDATVFIFHAGTREQVTGGRTYRDESSNPRRKELTAGIYDVAVKSVEIRNGSEIRWDSVRVYPDSTVLLQHDFPSGTIRVGAVNGSDLVDATVNIIDPTLGRSVAANRTYTADTSNPATFVMSPGEYTVRLKAVRLEGAPEREFEVTIEAGQESEHIVDFGAD